MRGKPALFPTHSQGGGAFLRLARIQRQALQCYSVTFLYVYAPCLSLCLIDGAVLVNGDRVALSSCSATCSRSRLCVGEWVSGRVGERFLTVDSTATNMPRSCHQCKKTRTNLLVCSTVHTSGRQYCLRCIKSHYAHVSEYVAFKQSSPVADRVAYECPTCRGICTCLECTAKALRAKASHASSGRAMSVKREMHRLGQTSITVHTSLFHTLSTLLFQSIPQP